MKLLRISDLEQKGSEQRIAQAETLYERYCQHLEEKQESQISRAPGIHASEVVGCTRKAFYGIKGVDKLSTPSLTWKRRLWVGQAIHEMLQKQFKSMKENPKLMVGFEDEVPISPFSNAVAGKYNIFSSCDGIFTFYDRNEFGWEQVLRVGCEIKTASPDSFAKLKAPDPKHVAQAHIYMACLDLPLMWFVYYNKGNQNLTGSTLGSFLIKFDPQIWAGLETRMLDLLAIAEKDELPSREEGIECEFCPYAWTCEPTRYQTQAPFNAGLTMKKAKRL